MIGYIIPVHPSSFIGIVIQKNENSSFSIYLNTSPQTLEEINKEFESLQDLVIQKDIPDDVRDIANKIASINYK